jgi:tRNA 2-thiouridine synthesizing protein A
MSSEHLNLKPDRMLDTSGLSCPIPIIRLNEEVKRMKKGELLEVIASDIGTRYDIPSWCDRTGNELVLQQYSEKEGVKLRYLIRKKTDRVDWYTEI